MKLPTHECSINRLFASTVKAATLIFIPGHGSVISFAKEGKIRFYL